MRIQHNIMAMNAYRNYNNNTSALSKNLEKLSSGYKINRAGDDAAGLAISEKMRAQITGLNAAQKNVKDGISLVKTAEGAMQEIQDMLNRMDYLATQSANGTYQDEVDREALQKEVNQLCDEINRIADSANFNGIKLLDGSLDAGTQVKTEAGKFEIGAADATASGALPALSANQATDAVGTGTILHKGVANDTSVNAFGMEFHDLEIKGDAGDTFTINIGGTTLTGTLAASAATTPLTGEDVAKALAGKDTSKITFTDANGDAYSATAFEINGGTFKAELSNTGRGVTFTQTDDAALTGDKVAMTVTIAAGVDAPGGTAPTVATTDGAAAVGGFDAGAANNGQTATILAGVDFSTGGANLDATAIAAIKTTVAVGGVDVDLSGLNLTTGTTYTEALGLINGAITAAMNAHNTAGAAGNATYDKIENAAGADNTGNGLTVTFDSTTQTYNANKTPATAATATVNFGTQTGADVIGSSVTVGDKTYTFYKAGETAPTGNNVVGVAVGEADNADTLATKLATATAPTGATAAAATNTVTFTTAATGATAKIEAEGQNSATPITVTGDYNIKTTDQSVKADNANDRLASTFFSLTDEMATVGSSIRIGDETYTFTDDAKAGTGKVYIGDLIGDDGKVAAADLEKVAQRLTDAAAKNTTYSVSQKGNTIQVVEQVGYTTGSQKYDLSTEEGIEESLGFTIATSTKGNGKTLQLQIGDTSDSYNQLQVSVGDMHTKALNIEGLSIRTAADASASIQTIKDAINRVSSVRGDLGAYQNRLEHTQNNLSVMAENIQDAESTIRDTDVAEEMMSYVKNNILVQSAQAMLAQANQVPQGVLQLLG